MNILFIEDNPEFANYTKSILEANKHYVIHISKADDILLKLKQISNNEFKLIVLDIMLRKGNEVDRGGFSDVGINIYKIIREYNKTIKIVILSARTKSEIWDNFEGDDMVKYHSKPIYSDTTKFLNLINNFEE